MFYSNDDRHPLDGFMSTVEGTILGYLREHGDLDGLVNYDIQDAVRDWHGHLALPVQDIEVTRDEEDGDVIWVAVPSFVMFGQYQSERIGSTITAAEIREHLGEEVAA